MNSMTKNVFTGLLVSVSVGALSFFVIFGTIQEQLVQIDAQVEENKFDIEKNRQGNKAQDIAVTRHQKEFERVNVEYLKMRRAVLCMLSVHSDENAMQDRLKCISEER